jgi:hypothetical protein
MVLLTAFVGGSLALVTTTASPARASCLAQPEEGTWRNIDPNTSGMTEARIESHCGDNVLCDENGNCTSDSGWYIRLYGRCHPTDCAWGQVQAVELAASDGRWLHATYHFAFKTSTAWLKTYSYSGRTYLRAYVVNHLGAAPVEGRSRGAV